MKINNLIMTLASVTALTLVSGCNQDPTPIPAPEAVREASIPTNRAQQATREAAQTVQGQAQQVTPAAAQRTEFLSQMRQDVTSLSADIDALAAKAANSGEAIKAESEVKLTELRAKVSRLGEQLELVPLSTESAWQQARESLGKSYDEARESVNQARTWLGDKIKP